MATQYQERKMRDPSLNPGDEPYFDAAKEGKLVIKKCNGCGKHHHYPRVLCPFCFSDKTEWVQAKGTGKIYTYSVTRRGGPTPYCLAYVELDEGVRMMTNIVDCDLDAINIGQKVKVSFKQTEGGFAMPVFVPA
jgi:uncharacterized OB-fold protein